MRGTTLRLTDSATGSAELLAQATNDFNRRSAQIPSVMITGPANYPTAKMREKTDRMMRAYSDSIGKARQDRVPHPHIQAGHLIHR